jgi:hypothetical protein
MSCKALPGQFPGELAITGNTATDKLFSLFVQNKSVSTKNHPTEGQSVDVWLRVEVIKQEGNVCVVRLPRQTLENGQFVTVKAEQLVEQPP